MSKLPRSLAVAFLILLFPLAAHAKNARIGSFGAELVKSPKFGSRVIKKLKEGTSVKTKGRAKNGYYRVQTTQGRSGWVSKDSLVFSSKKKKKRASKKRRGRRSLRDTIRKKDSEGNFSRLQFYGGLTFFSLSEVVNADTADVPPLTRGVYFGGQFLYGASSTIGIGARFNYMLRKVTVSETTTGEDITFTLSSIPVMPGVAISFVEAEKIRMNFSFFLGPAFGTILKAESETTFSEHSGVGFAAIPLIGVDIVLSENFGFMFEAGYRFLKTSDLEPAISDATPVIAKSVPLDLSGVLVGGGLSIYF